MSGTVRHNTTVAIVGGGVSGLYAAYLLEQRGVKDVLLLEARPTLGGRIVSVPVPDWSADAALAETHRFDLGPSWFWPGVQPQLDALVQALGLLRFEQHEAGDMVVERSPAGPPVRTRGYASAPPSMRLVGGMAALTDALHQRLRHTRVLTGQAVRRLHRSTAGVELESEDAAGQISRWTAGHVLLALPPRLASERIRCTPELPPALALAWRHTATWMAPHAKYVAVFDKPFWREQGLSGEARSACGPMAEVHDACAPGGSAALFGFVAVPARVRAGLAEEVLRAHCRAQLARLFGPRAAWPQAECLKDWAQDPYTASAADVDGPAEHVQAPAAAASSGAWLGKLTGVGSEWSPQFPGYIAGAIEAVSRGVASMRLTPA